MDDDELREWYALSPAQRFVESQRLWSTFLLLGGSCDPEPDSQSPFYFPPEEGEVAAEQVMLPKNRIEVNSMVMLGKPVVRGTRIPVELILRKLREGTSVDELLNAYPRLTRQDILASLAYAAGK